MFRRAAFYVDRILRGARPGELPAQAPSKFEFVINLRTAKALGLELPDALVALADERGVKARLMGGLAFHAVAPEWTARVSRGRRDIDLATNTKSRKAVQELLTELGYVPDRQYNALYGHKQLYFVDPRWDRPVDVLVDRLEMCHTFEFGGLCAVSDFTKSPVSSACT